MSIEDNINEECEIDINVYVTVLHSYGTNFAFLNIVYILGLKTSNTSLFGILTSIVALSSECVSDLIDFSFFCLS
jgi:hypothetical protein